MPSPKAGVIAALALVFSVSGLAGPKKAKKLPLPPLVYHGEKLSNYACEMTQISGTSVRYAWSLDVFAVYGEKHQRHWQKSLGVFEGPAVGEGTVTSHGPESAATGAPIGPITTFTAVGPAQQKCQEWKQAVREETGTPVKSGPPSSTKHNRR
ncbi:MAG: hypothetical protein KGL59_01750 [Acidobacteriota bacterium]|nr:hypothetical protein [Acidobacteriota bacterium]